MNKFYLYSIEEPEFSNNIQKYLDKKADDPSLQLVLFTEREDIETQDYVKGIVSVSKMLAEKGIEPHDLVVALDGQDAHYSPAEWNNIKGIRDQLQAKGIEFGFEDYNQIWSVEEVENANAQIDKSADDLRGKQYSPLEKLMAAYIDVTRHNYKFEDVTEHFSQSRSIYGVLNSDKIVCVGFAALLKSIIERDGEKNIQIYENNVACSRDNKSISGYHRNLIIYIKDPKYGLDGYYYVDPTWDASKQKQGEVNLNYFLVPLKDIQFLNTYILDDNSKLPRQQTSGKPQHRTKKTIKAMAKNKHKTYNRHGIAGSSFSRDRFAVRGELRTHVLQNTQVTDILKEYFALSDEALKTIEDKYAQFGDAFEQIKEYFIENKITSIPPEATNKFVSIIESGGTIEDCIDFAGEIVGMINDSGKPVDINTIKNNFLATLREKLQESKGVNSLNELIEILQDSTNPKDIDSVLDYQAQIDQLNEEIDQIIQALDVMFEKDPEKMINFVNNIKLEEAFANGSFFDIDLMMLGDFSQEAVEDCVNTNIGLMFTVDLDTAFSSVGYTLSHKLQEEKKTFYLEDSETRQMMIYDALCENSEPVPYDKMARALTVVLSKKFPEASPKAVSEKVASIMQRNAIKSQARYKHGATNSFYVVGSGITSQAQQNAQTAGRE